MQFHEGSKLYLHQQKHPLTNRNGWDVSNYKMSRIKE